MNQCKRNVLITVKPRDKLINQYANAVSTFLNSLQGFILSNTKEFQKYNNCSICKTRLLKQ